MGHSTVHRDARRNKSRLHQFGNKGVDGHFHRVCPRHTGGGRTGVFLIAHWTEPQKNGASEETLCPPRADGSIKQEGHVVPRPHRFQFLQQEDPDPGADSDAQRHPQLPSRAGGDPVKEE